MKIGQGHFSQTSPSASTLSKDFADLQVHGDKRAAKMAENVCVVWNLFPPFQQKLALEKLKNLEQFLLVKDTFSQTFSSKDFGDPQVQDDKRVAKMAEDVRVVWNLFPPFQQKLAL